MTLTEPTFDSIASSAKFIASPRKTNHAPLPCEKNAEIEGDSDIVKLTKKFPVLDMSFIKQIYFDSELKTDMPLFAAVDVKTGAINSKNSIEEKFTAYGRFLVPTIDSKLNPELKSISKKNPQWWLEEKITLGAFFLTGATSLFFFNGMAVFASLPIAGFFGICANGFYHTKIQKGRLSSHIITDFSYQFDGQIPDDVRAIYHKEKSNFDSIHLICDAKNRWVAEERPLPPPNPDPLLVGVKKLKSGKDLVFLLAKFDLTPAEQYIADEFAI